MILACSFLTTQGHLVPSHRRDGGISSLAQQPGATHSAFYVVAVDHCGYLHSQQDTQRVWLAAHLAAHQQVEQ